MVTNTPEVQFELVDTLQPVVEESLNLLADVDDAWQPSDLLPDLTREDWVDTLRAFREGSTPLTDELLIVMIGNMITEEALPSYAISLNRIARDPEGDSQHAWARWMRGWIGEENRHGDLMNAYLRLTGRVNMRAVEVSVHHLIARGFNPKAFLDPYAGLIYTSFQERATTISHANVGKLAATQGDENLSKICKRIAADEGRHERFYTRMVREVMDRDPETAILLFRKMMKRTIAMPGKNMHDGGATFDLFDRYATVTQRLGVYTIVDYANIIGYLVKAWRVGERSVTGQAAKAQEFLCVQCERLLELEPMMTTEILRREDAPFTWILPSKSVPPVPAGVEAAGAPQEVPAAS